MVLAQNLPTALAHAALANVELHVAAVALREEDRLLEDRHEEKVQRVSLHVESPVVRHGLTVLDVTAQDSQVQRPAMTRSSIVIAGRRPAAMIETNLSRVATRLQFKANDGVEPIGVSTRKAQLERGARIGFRDDGLPVIARTEVEVVRRAHSRLASRRERPPLIDHSRVADGFVHTRRRRCNRKVLQNVWHLTPIRLRWCSQSAESSAWSRVACHICSTTRTSSAGTPYVESQIHGAPALPIQRVSTRRYALLN
jgi:hypothetical protein